MGDSNSCLSPLGEDVTWSAFQAQAISGEWKQYSNGLLITDHDRIH